MTKKTNVSYNLFLVIVTCSRCSKYMWTSCKYSSELRNCCVYAIKNV